MKLPGLSESANLDFARFGTLYIVSQHGKLVAVGVVTDIGCAVLIAGQPDEYEESKRTWEKSRKRALLMKAE